MKVLFIGNSYTYFNDLPALFCRICQKNGYEAEADSVTAAARQANVPFKQVYAAALAAALAAWGE